MNAYKIEMIVVDHDNHGIEELLKNVRHLRYYHPDITAITEADIGEWSDKHPLGLNATSRETKLKYFDLKPE